MPMTESVRVAHNASLNQGVISDERVKDLPSAFPTSMLLKVFRIDRWASFNLIG
jgi:hypothetical protein